MADTYDIRLDAGADYAHDVQWCSAPTRLASAYTAADTTVTVYSTVGAASSGVIQIVPVIDPPDLPPPTFCLTYTGKTPTTFTGCSATGQHSTTAISCAAGAGVEPIVALTSYVARMSIRRDVADAAAVLALTSSPSAGLTVTAATGVISIAITAAQTAALSGAYVYDLELESSGGTVTRLLQGRLYVSAQVTY